MRKRLHYIDWLRVGAVLLLFPFHTLRVYDRGDPFYIKGPALSSWAGYVLAFIDTWHMPLLFALAGASTWFSLTHRGTGTYLLERVKRLLVPLVFGIFVLLPPQTWVGARFNSGYRRPFWRYLLSGDFLVFNIQSDGDYYGGFGIGHLWFILFLLLISAVALPMILPARRHPDSPRVRTFAGFLVTPAGLAVTALVILIAEALPDVSGKNLFYYLTFFVGGYYLMADKVPLERAERFRWPLLAAGLAGSVAWVFTGAMRDSLPDPSVPLALIVWVGMLARWLVVLGLLGLGRAIFDRPSPTLSYLAEASYPVYILHQTVIVVLAFWIVRASGPWTVQWLGLLAASVVVTFALYELVRRWNPVRFLFGMRPRTNSR